LPNAAASKTPPPRKHVQTVFRRKERVDPLLCVERAAVPGTQPAQERERELFG
jgi:hypothetical protein